MEIQAVDKIDDDIKVLVVVHPKEITEATQFALDQFVLQGWQVAGLSRPLSLFSTVRTGAQNPITNPMAGGAPGSTLDKLLPAWGLSLDTAKVVSHADFATLARADQGPNPSILSVNAEGVNGDDIVTGDIDNLLLVYAGAFTGTPAAGLNETVLIKSTKNAQLVDRMMAQFNGQSMANDAKTPNGVEVRDGGPSDRQIQDRVPERQTRETRTTKKPDAANKDKEKDELAPKKPEAKADDSLKESAGDKGSVILVRRTFGHVERRGLRPTSSGSFHGQRIIQP